MNENAALAEFADNLWKNYIKKKHDESYMDAVSFYRAVVVSNDGNNKLTIQRPYDNQIQVFCTDGMTNATAGMQVLVIKFGDGKTNANHVVVARGNGNPIGNGGSGLPAGGSTNDVLTKNSATDYDASWKPIPLKTYSANNPALTALGGICTWTVSHSLGKQYNNVSVYRISDGAQVMAEVIATSTTVTTIKIISSDDIAADTYKVVISGVA